MNSHGNRFKGCAASILCVTAALSLPAGSAIAAETAANATATATAGRPDTDTARDADRKPAEMVAFATVKPGQVVIDYIPGRGYFTRVFSDAVGTKGSVYAVTPQSVIDRFKDRPRPPPVSGEPGRGNVHEAIATGASMNVPAKADLVWTSQNYHDIHIWGGEPGAAELNKAAFDALKPGGYYVVLDHSGVAGLDDAGMAKLHRIDEAVVKKEVLAAGFKLDAESDALRHAADTRTAGVFDGSIRGKTDQFILRFRKP
jgi:predicted methyltransferase